MVLDYQWRAKKFPKPLANNVMMLNFQTKLLHQAVEYKHCIVGKTGRPAGLEGS
jgi:hypothetical protein